MPDDVLTVAELERLLAQAQQDLQSFPNGHPCLLDTLARVCRHALTQEAEVARLRWQIEGHAGQIAAQAEVIARRAEKPDRPRRVCLCGSTRFKQQFIEANYRETMAGRIVLTVGWFSHTDAHVYSPTEAEKDDLDKLHLAKIDLADEVLVINVGGYIGDSTRREIQHALSLGKPVRYLSGEQQVADDQLPRLTDLRGLLKHEVHEDDGDA